MKLYKTALFAGAALAGAAISATVLAHSGATGIVAERMDHMMMLRDAVKELTAMFTGEATYDAAKVRNLGNLVKDHGGDTMTTLFPEGSGGGKSEAKPEIWQDWETFSALALQLETFGGALSDAAENPRGGMHAGGMMGQSGSGMMGKSGGMMGQSGGMMGQSGGGMMGQSGGGMMGGGAMPQHSREALAQMPPDMVFGMVVQTCSACHTQFRAEKN